MLTNLRKMPPFASAVNTKPKPTNTKKKSKNLIKVKRTLDISTTVIIKRLNKKQQIY